MKPIYQTKFGEPEGNCFIACLASIMELPLNIFPNFCEAYPSNWLFEVDSWLGQYGYRFMFVSVQHRIFSINNFPRVFHLMGGPSERNCLHSVVAFSGYSVHDPHPSNAGLLKIQDYGFLIPINPKISLEKIRCEVKPCD